MGLVLTLTLHAAVTSAQSTGGSFGGSRGFGGGSSSGSSSSGSSSGGSRSGWGGSSSSSRSTSAGESSFEREQREAARRRDEETARRARERREEERRRARQRLEQERLERESLARDLARPPEARARSERFTGVFAFPYRSSVLLPDARGGAVAAPLAWWGGEGAMTYLPREYRRPWTGYVVPTLLGLAIVVGLLLRLRAIWRGAAPAPVPRATVRTLTVAVDWTRRRAVQRSLAEQAGRHDLSTAAGMFAAWRDAQAVLRDAAPAVRYVAHAQSTPVVADAQREFDARATDLRGRYIIETIRDDARVAGPAVSARGEEGEGMVVVSVVLGLGAALPAIAPTASVGDVVGALGGDDPEALVALQTIWSPTHEDDRMSSAEVEACYPELRRLDEGVGRVRCGSCKAVWAKELGRCPACGAAPDA